MRKDSVQQRFFNRLVKVCGHNNLLVTPILFIEFFKDRDTASIASQLLYWCDKGKSDDGYIYKSESDWFKETGLSSYIVNKCTAKLKAMNIIDMKKKMANGSNTWHYKLNHKYFFDLLMKYLGLETKKIQSATLKNKGSITEPKTELTTKHINELNEEKENYDISQNEAKEILKKLNLPNVASAMVKKGVFNN